MTATLQPVHVVAIWLAAIIVLVLGTRALLPHRRSVVLCPGSKLPAMVEVDGHLAVEACSRRVSGQDCNHGCLLQLAFSVDQVTDFLSSEVRCTICGGALSEDDWYASRLAGSATPSSRRQVAALVTDKAMCWNCYQALSP